MSPELPRTDSKPTPLRDALVVVLLLAAATAVSYLLDAYVSLTSHAMLYVLAVVVASYTLSWAPSLACAFGAVLAFNFFFVPPRFTFEVENRELLIALFTMLALALVISHLGSALRRETDAARLNERRARQLQALATGLTGCTRPEEVVSLGRQSLGDAFAGPAVLAGLAEDGTLALPPDMAGLQDGMLCCMREAATLGPGTGRWPGLDAWYIPLGEKDQITGAACIQNISAADHSGREHAQALCALVAQALWRLKLTASIRAAREESERHNLHSTFLAAISHDLRTPLAAIVGAASSLQTQRDKLGAAEQDRLLASIQSEASYLSRVTDNTLQLVRLGKGGGLQRDWEAMEEIVGAVLARVRQRDTTRRIRSSVPPGLPLIKADPVLLAQLLENLLDNALKYSNGVIELAVTRDAREMQVAVQDRGAGIAPGEEDSIFEPYRRSDRSGQRGAGLGLAVCRAIASAHGGTLTVSAREGGGSRFTLHLPIEAEQPAPEPS